MQSAFTRQNFSTRFKVVRNWALFMRRFQLESECLTGQKDGRKGHILWEAPYRRLSALTGQNFFDKMVRKMALSMRLSLLETECPHWPQLLWQDGKENGTFYEKVPTGHRVPSLARTSLTRWYGKGALFHGIGMGKPGPGEFGQNFFDKFVRRRALFMRLFLLEAECFY
jgi:hypothetical protein